MALINAGDIMTEFLVRNNTTTTDSFVTDTTLQGWLKDAHTWAASYKKWPMTEGKASTTSASATTSPEGYTTLSFPEGFKADSIRLLTVGGTRFQKKNFYKFQSFLEDKSGDTSNIFTDYGRQILINPRADGFSGTVVFWGQYTPIIDVTDTASTTIFSGYDDEGNQAIVEKMSAFYHDRQHSPLEALANEDRAAAILENVASRIGDEQYAYQDTNNDGMWKRMDIVHGGFRDDIFNRDQFN